jgi:hypothetical protein
MKMQKQSPSVMLEAGFSVTGSIVFTGRLGIFAFVLAMSAATVVADDHDSLRSWHSRDGNAVEASLEGFHSDQHVATLKQSDGSVIEVPFKSLSREDQRYIKTWLRQQRNTDSQAKTDPGQDDRNPVESQSKSQVRNSSRSKSNRGSEKTMMLYGINWHESGAPALAKARGVASTSDDMPIMWFRVLGDLEGFM